MTTYKLWGRAGWGSSLVEAQLAWYGLPFTFEPVGDLFREPDARTRLETVNPLAQVPTLILPDGSVMSESAARESVRTVRRFMMANCVSMFG